MGNSQYESDSDNLDESEASVKTPIFSDDKQDTIYSQSKDRWTEFTEEHKGRTENLFFSPTNIQRTQDSLRRIFGDELVRINYQRMPGFTVSAKEMTSVMFKSKSTGDLADPLKI